MEKTIVKRIKNRTTIEGRICSYDSDQIREEILAFSKANSKFNLPHKYTWVITPINGFAKIIEREMPKPELSTLEKKALGREAIDYMISAWNPEEHGENMDLDCLQQIICELSGYNFEHHK